MKKYIKSYTEIEDDWDVAYDPYKGHRYRIHGGYSDTEYTDDPYEAIRIWFEIGEKYPSDTCIMCRTRDAACAVVMEGTESYLTKLYNRYRCPYKLEYLIDECDKAFENGCKYFYENGFGDQVHPFSVG